jgi:hypothetical protein
MYMVTGLIKACFGMVNIEQNTSYHKLLVVDWTINTDDTARRSALYIRYKIHVLHNWLQHPHIFTDKNPLFSYRDNFIICTILQVQLEWSSQGGWDGQGM